MVRGAIAHTLVPVLLWPVTHMHSHSYMLFYLAYIFYFTRLGAFFIMNVVVVDRRQDRCYISDL